MVEIFALGALNPTQLADETPRIPMGPTEVSGIDPYFLGSDPFAVVAGAVLSFLNCD